MALKNRKDGPDLGSRILSAGFILLVALNLFLSFRISRMGEELNIAGGKTAFLNTKIEELAAERQSILNENKRLQTLLSFYRKKAINQPSLSPKEIEELRMKGLRDPLKEIKADLMKHNELIPYKGILGGTMAFQQAEEIHVLSTSLVRAYFEDGHMGGWMLLEYRVTDGKILWKVLDSSLNTSNNNSGEQ